MQKKKIFITLKGNRVICNVPEIQTFFSVVGVKYFDGQFSLPKNGRHFLAALFDYYIVKLHGLLYPQGN